MYPGPERLRPACAFGKAASAKFTARGPARALPRLIQARCRRGPPLGPGCGRGPGAAAAPPVGALAPFADSPPACHYRRRLLQGIYWGQGLLTGTRLPKLTIEGKNGPESHCWGALLKRQDPFHRDFALEGLLGLRVRGMNTPHWLTGAEKRPPCPLPAIPRAPTTLRSTNGRSDSQIVSHSQIVPNP